MREFRHFDDATDPLNEHDLAFFEAEGEKWFFKWDYYDLTLERHSPDPSDPAVTCRMLTVGHETDY